MIPITLSHVGVESLRVGQEPDGRELIGAPTWNGSALRVFDNGIVVG